MARVFVPVHDTSLVLGLSRPEDYRDAPHAMGVVVGPVAGRVSNATTQVNGKLFRMPTDMPPHCLHSGPGGVQNQLWDVLAHTSDTITLQLTLPDGAVGLPGNRTFTATYQVTGPDLHVALNTESDKDTIANLASHAYWCLDGTGDLSHHLLQVQATRMCETGSNIVPTGRVLNILNSQFDFTKPRCPISNLALDGCFCLADEPVSEPKHVMSLMSSHSGLGLEVATNQPGLVLYTAANLPDMPAPPKTPRIGPYSGIAIEAQGWPDANNHQNFPAIVLKSGTTCRQITTFSVQMP